MLCPRAQVPGQRDRQAQISVQLLEDVFQGRRRGNAGANTERKAIRLAWTMIRVLADNDHFDFVRRCSLQSLKDEVLGRENLFALSPFFRSPLGQLDCQFAVVF